MSERKSYRESMELTVLMKIKKKKENQIIGRITPEMKKIIKNPMPFNELAALCKVRKLESTAICVHRINIELLARIQVLNYLVLTNEGSL